MVVPPQLLKVCEAKSGDDTGDVDEPASRQGALQPGHDVWVEHRVHLACEVVVGVGERESQVTVLVLQNGRRNASQSLAVITHIPDGAAAADWLASTHWEPK